MKQLLIAGTALALVAFQSVSANAAITFFSSIPAFDAAAGTVVVEDFADTTLVPGLSFTSTVGAISGGLFNDRVVRGGATTTFNIAGGTNAFGGLWNEQPGGFGQGLDFTITLLNLSTVVLATQLDGFSGQFFGFTSTDKFDTVLITAGNSGGVAETYNLDDLRFGAGVPEPTTWALMLLGFGGLGLSLRRARRESTTA